MSEVKNIPGTSVTFDETEITQPAGAKPSRWVAPRHVFFGGKDENGEMIPEPVYIYKEYPRAMYRLDKTDQGLKMKVVHVNDDESKQDRIDDGFKLTIAEWGILTCPSFEQIVEMKNLEEGAKRQALSELKVVPTKPVESVDASLELVAAAKPKRVVKRKGGKRKAA